METAGLSQHVYIQLKSRDMLMTVIMTRIMMIIILIIIMLIILIILTIMMVIITILFLMISEKRHQRFGKIES